MKSETEKVKERYERRKSTKRVHNIWFSKYAQCKRELKYFEIIKKNFDNISNRNIMGIGEGSGDILIAFQRFGFDWDYIYANELLDDRVDMLKQNLPNSKLYLGDALGRGTQSSKDYTKVDRSGLYAGRWLAKHTVASGLAKKCIVQLSYAIGVVKPTSVTVDTMGTYTKNNDDILSSFISDAFTLIPNWITKKFNLDKPSEETFLYADVASRGQVGQSDYPWEQLDELELFKKLNS